MSTLNDIKIAHKESWDRFMKTKELPMDLYQPLFWHFCTTKEMPYEVATQHHTAKEDPVEWLERRLLAKETG